MADNPRRPAGDPSAEGERAARDLIPAEANPYPKDSDAFARWKDGHNRIAAGIEAGESEDSG